MMLVQIIRVSKKILISLYHQSLFHSDWPVFILFPEFFPSRAEKKQKTQQSVFTKWMRDCQPWGTEGREGVRRLCQWTSEIRDTGARTGKRMVIPVFRDSGTIVGFFIVGAKVLKPLSRICGVILLLLSSVTANAAAGGRGDGRTLSLLSSPFQNIAYEK